MEEKGPCVETSGWIRESNPLECGLEYQEAAPGFVFSFSGSTSAMVASFFN
jgi:hypothetical protein